MYIARILYPVNVLGPGKRVGIWFDGCDHHCQGCSNPELWTFQEKYNVSLQTIMKLIGQIDSNYQIDGFTITGGDPFKQPEALENLLTKLSKITQDILVYTGFEYEEVFEKYPGIISKIGVLIDGKYIHERNNGAILRGSDNQNIILLNEQLTDKYGRYFACAENKIQNFTTLDGVISVGIHRPEYAVQIDDLLRKKGLEKYE